MLSNEEALQEQADKKKVVSTAEGRIYDEVSAIVVDRHSGRNVGMRKGGGLMVVLFWLGLE